MGDIAELAVGNEVGASLKQGRPGWDDGIGVGVTQIGGAKRGQQFCSPTSFRGRTARTFKRVARPPIEHRGTEPLGIGSGEHRHGPSRPHELR